MTVKAGIAKLGDLLGQKLDTVGRVAENDGLVDLELGEQGVEAVDLLLLLDEGIVLGNTPKRKLIHQVDFVRADHVLVGEVLDRKREGSREQHDLAIPGVVLKQLLNDRGELDGQKLVSFVHDEHGAFAEIGNRLSSEIENSARSAHYYVDGILKADNVVSQARSAGRNHDVDTEVLAKGLADLRGLHGKLACRDEDEALDFGDLGVDLFESGNNEGCGFAGAVLCTRKDVSAGKSNGYAFFLNRGGLFETSFENAHEQVPLQLEVLELQPLCVCNILWNSIALANQQRPLLTCHANLCLLSVVPGRKVEVLFPVLRARGIATKSV